MQHLRAVAIENGAILATAQDGSRYRIELDEELRARLRGSAAGGGAGRKSSPREIQTYIRGGMSAEQVAKLTGAPLEYVQRYEGPILAEREYMASAALAVPILSLRNPEDPEGAPPTFGAVLAERLTQLAASGTRWSSWKEPEGGWVLKVAFTADSIEHDARWAFDAKKSALLPLNSEAVALSQQGDLGGTLMPRLRAVTAEPGVPSTSRFDSAVFDFPEEAPTPDPVLPLEPAATTGRVRLPSAYTGSIGIVGRDQPPAEPAPTADLLEALRRRRGERESASFEDERPEGRHPSTGAIRLLERVRGEQPTDSVDLPGRPSSATGPVPTKGSRRGRTSMPSWDEIVFGARPEDDPA
ncbi:MAG: hypothetical protein JWR33_1766 [Naasia sp.]|jgi:hypothetical protein|uniref:septation protein SepH n=1 Tax=Naasia sp. TaxID=2546198 RepID=UPI002618687F|nr:septation protein SepH [Naasia sp.]MCU1571025.1 hypothetical protein [Naasia sp.]